MIDLISVENMRNSDSSTIASGTDSKELMRRAGIALMKSRLFIGSRILIAVGKGNNGGDGFALASLLKDEGIDSTIVFISDEVSEDASYFKAQCIEKQIPMIKYNPKEINFKEYDIIVDCLLGTGFKGEPKDYYPYIIDEINNSGSYVISADINSGVNGDTGEYTKAIKSNLTVTIGYLKRGLLFLNERMINKVKIADIGITLLQEEDKVVPIEDFETIQSPLVFDDDHCVYYKNVENKKIYLCPGNIDLEPIVSK